MVLTKDLNEPRQVRLWRRKPLLCDGDQRCLALEVDALHPGARGVGGESDLVRHAEVEPVRGERDAGNEKKDGEDRLRPAPLLLQATEIAQLGFDRGLRLLGGSR